jgi:hypothetical protein
VDGRRGLFGRQVVTAAAFLLAAACASSESCAQASSATDKCADLSYNGNSYDEWREIKPPPILQELGDALYPACNEAGRCGGDDLGGLGATDVWLVEGVDPEQAVIGVREGSETYVIYVRLSTDPDTLKPLIDPSLIG